MAAGGRAAGRSAQLRNAAAGPLGAFPGAAGARTAPLSLCSQCQPQSNSSTTRARARMRECVREEVLGVLFRCFDFFFFCKSQRLRVRKRKGSNRHALLLVSTLSHKEESLSRDLSCAFKCTKANDTVPRGVPAFGASHEWTFVGAVMHTNVLATSIPPPPGFLAFVSLTKKQGSCRCARRLGSP